MAASKADNLTREKVLLYREVFTSYGQEDKNRIQTKDLGTVMRSLGKIPSDSELMKMIKNINADEKGFIEFHEFLSMIQTMKDYTECEDEIIEAFKVFDKKNSGTASLAELKEALTTLGEKLSEEEVEDLFQKSESNEDGQIHYLSICKAVLK